MRFRLGLSVLAEFTRVTRELANRYSINTAVTVLYLVSMLIAPPILHPTDHFLGREVF